MPDLTAARHVRGWPFGNTSAPGRSSTNKSIGYSAKADPVHFGQSCSYKTSTFSYLNGPDTEEEFRPNDLKNGHEEMSKKCLPVFYSSEAGRKLETRNTRFLRDS